MRYGRWEDALVAKEQHLRFLNSRRGISYMDAVQESLNAQHDPRERIPQGLLWTVLKIACEEGAPIYVSDDVTEVIDVARKTFEPEPLLASDIFTPHGFMLFPRPLLLNDHPKYGEATFIAVRAVAWTTLMDDEDPSVGCVWVSYLSHYEDDPTYAIHLPFWERVEQLGLQRGLYEVDRNAALTAAHVCQMTFGRDPHDIPVQFPIDELERGLTPEQLAEQHRGRGYQQWVLPQVAWRLASQLVRAPMRPPRPTRREMERWGRPSPDVTVIRLRRYREPMEHDGEFKGALTVRFVVSGHWRKQWYPSLQQHRQIWIAPYVKGPDGAPFRVTDKVYEFVR